MRAGPLRHRVALQSLVETPDVYGQLRESWDTVGTYWAEVRPLNGREASNAAQMESEMTHFVRMRYVGPIGPTQRLLLGNRVFNILAVKNMDERRREYQIQVQEIVAPVTTP